MAAAALYGAGENQFLNRSNILVGGPPARAWRKIAVTGVLSYGFEVEIRGA